MSLYTKKSAFFVTSNVWSLRRTNNPIINRIFNIILKSFIVREESDDFSSKVYNRCDLKKKMN